MNCAGIVDLSAVAGEAEAISKSETGHILIVGLVGYSIFLPVEDQRKMIDELDEIVRSTVRFRVADVAGRVICRTADGCMTLVFLSDPEAPVECAMEIAIAAKNHHHADRLRMGIHKGPVNLGEGTNLAGAAIGTAQRIKDCGDAGHILLSKRTAFDLAPVPRWSAHLFELGPCELPDGEKISLVNFYTKEVGNPQVPTKLRRAQHDVLARARRRALWRSAALTAAVALFIFGIGGGIFIYRRNAEPLSPVIAAPEKSIAVLPLVDLSAARDQQYFCDGVSEEILDALAKVKGLRVIARASSFSFQGKNQSADEIARKLNVSTILRGNFRRDDKQIRISAQLINARDGSQVWSKIFERELADVFVIQNEIVRAVLDAEKIQASAAPPLPARRETIAYDPYLQGLFLSHKDREEDLRASLDFFRLALGKDPGLGRAWTGIAKDWLRLAGDYVPPLDIYPQVQIAANKALALDEQNAEAHVLLGETKRIFDWDLKSEEFELKRALEIEPNSIAAHLSMALLRASLGDSEQGLAEMQRAVQLDPFSPIMGNWEVNALVANDRLDQAFAAVERIMEIDPNYAYFEPNLALVYREQGKLHEALDIYLRLQKTRHQPMAGLAITYARLDRHDDARKILDELIQIANTRYFPAEQIAAVYVALGDKEQAFHWLERAVDERSVRIQEIAFAREFRPLRSDPQFGKLLRRIGLDSTRFQNRQLRP